MLIYTRLHVSLQLHDVLHRSRPGRGTGNDIIELMLAQELSIIDQYSLFLFLLDLRKAYDTMDQERLLMTLEGCGAGPHLCGILETFEDRQKVVPIYNGFQRPTFLATRGITQ